MNRRKNSLQREVKPNEIYGVLNRIVIIQVERKLKTQLN